MANHDAPVGRGWSVVVPTVRPDRFADLFLPAWRTVFARHRVHLIVVEDQERRSPVVASALERTGLDHTHLCHQDLPEWCPRGTDMIRSEGFFVAWQGRSEWVLSIDDDVTPVPQFDPIAEHEAVFRAGAPLCDWLDVGALTTGGVQMRGFPYGHRASKPVGVQWGGWQGVLDFDAPTQLATRPQGPHHFAWHNVPVPRGVAVTGCAMNMAFRRDLVPIMWQLPMLEGRYNRFGDIWSGLLAKRVLDAIGEAAVINGKAQVRHERASDPVANLVREAPGVPVNEGLWDALATALVKPDDKPIEAYRAVTNVAAEHFHRFDPAYADHFRWARDAWLARFP